MGGGPPGFPQGFSCPVVLWILQRVFWFRLPDFHRLWSAFPKQFDYHSLHRLMQSTTPKNQVLRFGLFPFRSPLLRKSIFLSPPIATYMFQFTTFPSIRYGFTYGYLRFAQVGFPIQKSPDRWLFAPPRSFSQLTTSFIGSQCQGIHPVLFLA